MGQQEVIELLEKERQPLTSLEIHHKLKISKGSVSDSIKRLVNHNEINKVNVLLKGRRYIFKYCRK